MLSKLRTRSQSESGFTLVELLVVMLILGLLAAIAIPAFFNQRDKATDASAKEAVRTAETAMETLATDNGGSYASATTAKLDLIEPTLNNVGANLVVNSANAADYEIQVTSGTGNVFKIARNSSGVTTLSCTTTGKAGCPTSGLWG
jgi:type IV pilus assembly protein PilA